uniref:Odorant-binding protein n=1 Tax=Phenacoccus solenopsis TaxID=483260 RepID=A0A0U2LIN9_9HEMI|nr:odorant-binding protein [Phenacoccus solenopsis]
MLSFALIVFAFFQLGFAVDKKEIMASCMQQYSVGEEVFKNFLQNGEVPDESNKNQKCLFLCVISKLGMSDESGNMDMPKVKEMMVAKYDKMTPENVIALVEKCAVRSEADPCDKIYQFHKCHMKPYLEVVNG